MGKVSGGSITGLFFRRFLAHPGRVASVFPSSQAMGRLIARQIKREDDEYVVELGAGTGSVTRAILGSGVPAEKLIVVEIDKEMAAFLRKTFPGVTVLECSAFDLAQSLPQDAVGKVGCVVSCLPSGLYPPEQQRRLAEIMFSLMPPGRALLALTHRLDSPIQAKKIGLTGKRLGFTLRNVPPGSVWAYTRSAGAAAHTAGPS